MRSGGGGPSISSHQMSLSGVRAMLVKRASWVMVRMALGLVLWRGAGRNAEVAGFGIDGVEAAVGTGMIQAMSSPTAFDFPAGKGGGEHGEIGFSAGAGEGGGDVLFFALRIGDAEDEHVLGEPPFIATEDGGDAEGQTLFSEEGVAAVAAAKRPDGALFGEMDDDAVGGIAGPGNVGLAGFEGDADRMDAGNEGVFEVVESGGAHAGHELHVEDDVGRVGDLDADFGVGRSEGPHAIGNDVERAAAIQPGKGS